ncbi:MAG: 50S ribosomal protein L18Ae [Candidatus ainarchaeum sp.]|nr:50S ribosomal protein L18Ae [Candidatus ainarchaeum sp.]
MVKFTIKGRINIGKERKFVKEIDAKSEKEAREQVYALFGSQNKLKRTRVMIDSVEKVN